ncbi:MAG: hypothetical protein HYU66_15750 [Armatimonadetes bacterium]|nr:hypothetical protein [Armatimonadota bacterium]
MRGCLVGFLGAVAAFFFACAVSAGAEAGLGTALIILVWGLIPAIAAAQIYRSGRRETAAVREAREAALERRALEVAAGNHGVVTPSTLALGARGVTIAAAKKLLDRLAVDGFCTVDSDDAGRLLYRFAVGGEAAEEELSPEEWVARMSRQRMSGAPPATRGVSAEE